MPDIYVFGCLIIILLADDGLLIGDLKLKLEPYLPTIFLMGRLVAIYFALSLSILELWIINRCASMLTV